PRRRQHGALEDEQFTGGKQQQEQQQQSCPLAVIQGGYHGDDHDAGCEARRSLLLPLASTPYRPLEDESAASAAKDSVDGGEDAGRADERKPAKRRRRKKQRPLPQLRRRWCRLRPAIWPTTIRRMAK
uniref:Os01g0772100 protein n=1 Tax=Macrostomum lignano TaxID=282301 RepID=A0A1I8FAP7_9PLAT